MKDFELRPYRIAAEIDTLFNNQKFSGIGELHFLGSNQIILTDEFNIINYENGSLIYKKAMKNFIASLAGYSLVCYFLQIKDRHNGNILLDRFGNIIHIDFGFILGISPGGNMNFENAPFKLTKDYIQIMDGIHSEIFLYFKSLIFRGLITVRKYYQEFITLAEIMAESGYMPCFKGRDTKEIIQLFKERFLIGISETEVENIVEDLVDDAASSWRTTQYDFFQKFSNGILP